MTHLLDTDTCIALLRGHPAAISHAQTHPPADLGVSTITRYELNYGVARCPEQWRTRESHKVRDLLDQLTILPFTEEAADLAAQIRADLEAQGKPIGAMDILIAATALSQSIPLITGNLREFQRIPGLTSESWFD